MYIVGQEKQWGIKREVHGTRKYLKVLLSEFRKVGVVSGLGFTARELELGEKRWDVGERLEEREIGRVGGRERY